ncbi:probable disease resistance protein At5g66900 [Rosa chinensis]|nr:probable disease resistance protein At5g66900 [Rosa chinensis]XP_040371174.1 probable disease resistance protein At5g66900 [Rosa chinensis]XP_040371175.1 probable disease resistance protein At5g66900 [Rosa chinensis]XP_040371176.1 probable disease resistance protein At5g66900 [Rosa chinensis]XP_040371177.1 probable disease resistance protein At5g66900 [Rosa chinensis]XP_040371178.1 probable disease resistance protein At5g66900 [Rosa chinensis]
MVLVRGEALEASFVALYDAIKEVNEHHLMFKALLGDIRSTLDSIEPLIKETAEDDKELDFPEDELQNFGVQMEEGIELIRKCSKVGPLSTYKKYKYTNKLGELGKSLQRLLDILKVHSIRDVKKTLVTIKNIETKVQQIDVNIGIQNNSSESIEGSCAIPEPPPLVVGLDGPLKELKMKLFSDEISMLVLTAPGGCGKTTLATKFCQDGDVRDKFKNNIFFVTVSKKPNLNLIVEELYQRKGSQVPDFQHEVIALNWLYEFLNQMGQDPLLLVLDDVWSESEFLLEKFDEWRMSNCKILVTSRFAFPRFGSPYNLKSLSDEDAFALFNHSAYLGDVRSHVPEDLARQVIKHCKGFPLAITVVGRSLCGQPIEIWQKRLIEWTKGSSILDSDHDLLVCLQSSLDALEKQSITIKECFLDLGSFPEDQRIPATTLIDIWAESYKIDEDWLCIANLCELTNRNLATLIITRKDPREVDGYYSEHFVTLHDIIRELAIYQSSVESIEQRKRLIIDMSGDNFPEWWTEQKCQPINAHLLSISTDGDFSSKWLNMQLPQAEVLILNFQSKKYALPEFVEKMDKLKVLIVTKYGLLPAELDNFPLLGSLSNLKRIRLERIAIPSMSKTPVQLKSLEKISLFMCKVGQAFDNCSIELFNLLPNVVEMNIDYCNDLVKLPAMLCDLICLKKLSITNSHKLSVLPEEIGKLVNLKVLRLRSCTELSELPDSIRNLKLLNFLDISDCFSMKELPEHIGEMCCLETLNMRQCSRLQELPASVLDLEQLKDVICDEETEILWNPFLPILHNLHIRVVKEDINLNWLHTFPS